MFPSLWQIYKLLIRFTIGKDKLFVIFNSFDETFIMQKRCSIDRIINLIYSYNGQI